MLSFPIFLGRPRIVLPSVTVRWTVTGRKNSTISGGVLYVGITYLPGQSPAKYCRRT